MAATAGAPARLGALVDRITAAAPDVTVLVSSIVPNANADRNKRVVAYNAAIPQLVAERRNKGAHVGYVDMGAVATGDLADRLHPNDAGFAKMAEAFAKGVAQAAADGWIRETVNVRSAPLRDQPIGDYGVDLDADDHADYLVVRSNGAVDAWRNNNVGDSAGGWSGYGRIAGGVGAPGKNIRFADINGDRRADYIALDDNGAARVWLKKQDGRDTWSSYGLIAGGVGEPADAVRFSDVDGDGKADYVTVQDQGSLRAWGNQGGDPGNGWRSYGRIASGVAASFRIRI